MNADEFAHMIRQVAGQQQIEFRPLVYGHVSSYDPATHQIKAILPALRGDDSSPVETPWMPMTTVGVGAGYGLQIAPVGGATLTNPTGGEQIIVGLFGNSAGGVVCASLGLTWNLAQLAPGGLSGGDAILKHPTGSYLRTDGAGNVTTYADNNVNHIGQGITQTATASIVQNASLDIVSTAQRNMQMEATGTLSAGGGAMAFTSTGTIGIVATGNIDILSTGQITMAGTNALLFPKPPTAPGASGQIWNHNGTLMIS